MIFEIFALYLGLWKSPGFISSPALLSSSVLLTTLRSPLFTNITSYCFLSTISWFITSSLSSCKAKKNLSSPKFLRSDCFITEVRKTLKQIYLKQFVCWYTWKTDQKGVLWLIINLVMNKERTKYTISTVITMFCFNVIGWGNRSYNKHCSRGDLI